MEGIDKGCLKNYEKLKLVGKGAFGVAYLYRKCSDEKLVVIKEINMIESSASERQMALNEVQILSVLNHQNIISYFRSFEMDGVLMIEMEYAEGGTLAQYLKNLSKALKELEIVQMFHQIVSAVRYIHDHNILHRDLKTANIFLTKEKNVKVGDFGISKIMETKTHAETVLGTPYYISPEMCEGKLYDQKSDIWALGCILYEMACLQKTFEGTNLLVLVNKITKGHFQLPTGYSERFLNLLHELLSKDPTSRPTAAVIEDYRIPSLIGNLSKNSKDNFSEKNEKSIENKVQTIRSVLYKLKKFKTNFSLTPIQLPSKTQIIQLATSKTHCVALTVDLKVFSWGINSRGQLGHGDCCNRKNPTIVETLKGKKIKIIKAGDGFSVFVTESGMLMTCGNGRTGCLGHGDNNDIYKPKVLEKLLSEDIVAVGCGSHHVVVLTKQAAMYSWGRNQNGCLGLGGKKDCFHPYPVNILGLFTPKKIRCGWNSTVVIGTDGSLFACGNNTHNKLGLNEDYFPFLPNLKSGEEEFSTLQKVKRIRTKIRDLALGPSHSIFLTEQGYVLTLGNNQNHQLGRKVHLLQNQLPLVKTLATKDVTMIQCGPTFSLASTSNNTLYFWGSRSKQTYDDLKSKPNYKDCEETEVIKEPEEILALYASPEQRKQKEFIQISGIYTHQDDVLLVVETSIPVQENNYEREKGHKFFSQETNEVNAEQIPDWIKTEFAESVTPPNELNFFKFD